jgi:3-oxoacyl-[acyl-carrier protein] reductase
VKKIFAETKKAFGRLDILVNNAGVYNLLPLEEVTEEDFHRHFNINVLGLLLATREAAKLFGDEGGSVINIGSVVSDLNPPNSVVYTATKGAVDAVTRVLAKELGPRKIRVNSINPGVIETEGTHAAGVIGSDFEKQFVALTPLGRTGQPDDIAPVAVSARRPFAPRIQRFGVSGSQNCNLEYCNLELSHAHIRDEESCDSPGGQFAARRSKFPARLNKFPVRRELIPCFIL